MNKGPIFFSKRKKFQDFLLSVCLLEEKKGGKTELKNHQHTRNSEQDNQEVQQGKVQKLLLMMLR